MSNPWATLGSQASILYIDNLHVCFVGTRERIRKENFQWVCEGPGEKTGNLERSM